MALNIKNAEAEELARLLAKKTGASITEVVTEALREKLRREEGRAASIRLKDELMSIGRRCAALPDLDTRTPEEILGYGDDGAPA